MAIVTSKNSAEKANILTSVLKLKSSNYLARFAICFSLSKEKKFDLTNDSEHFDSNGKKYTEEILFGKINSNSNKIIYKLLLNQHYEHFLYEDDFLKLIRLHLNDGINRLYENINTIKKDKDNFILSIIRNKLSIIKNEIPIKSTITKDIASYKGLINLTIGKNNDGQSISVKINDLNEFDSHHISVAGMTGSGKTEFIKDILYQISNQSNNQLNFMFFDYKGEGFSEKIDKFCQKTNCEFINLNEKAFPLNPMEFIDTSDERAMNHNITSLIDSIVSISPGLGVKQQMNLKQVIYNSFKTNNNQTPSFDQVYKELQEYYEEKKQKPDSLYQILDSLSSGLFSEQKLDKEIYDYNSYVSLPNSLSDSLRQLSVFLILKYLHTEFNRCDDVKPDENRINPLRYVIVIDEAHVYLKNKNASKILETILRDIRSKGVVVILLSQGPSDYKTPNFDFASQVKIPICLNIQDKDPKVIKSYVGTPRSEIKLNNAIRDLTNGKAVINITEPELIDINMFWQREFNE